MKLRSVGIVVMGLGLILSACAAPGTGGSAARGGGETTRLTPKRIVAAIMADPPIVVQALNPASHWRGVEHIQSLVAGGLTRTGERFRQPELAEALPSV